MSSMSCKTVVRSLSLFTTPSTPFIWTQSPEPVLILQQDEEARDHTRTRFCAPKPSANPTTPAPASNDIML